MEDGQLIDEEYDEKEYSVCAVPGAAPTVEIKGVDGNGSEKTFKIPQYKGKYLVIVFYHADWECNDLVQSFSSISSLFESNGAKLVACSSDSASTHKSWIQDLHDIFFKKIFSGPATVSEDQSQFLCGAINLGLWQLYLICLMLKRITV